MAVTFLKSAIKDALSPKFSIIDLVQKNVGGFKPERSHKEVHASDITKEDFCPREYAMLDLTNGKKKDVYIPTALQTTFDMGEAVAGLTREKWVAKAAVGNWYCPKCGEHRSFTRHPGNGCVKSKHCPWQYEEVKFESKTYGFTGSLDLIVDLGAPKYFVTELKIMAPDQFEKLLAPLAEHRIRTSIYMQLIEDSGSPYAPSINVERARILYVSRGYGKKNQQAGEEIIPLKEFEIVRDDLTSQPYLNKALEVKKFREHGVIPAGICATPQDTRAKKCGACKACFSGAYPAGKVIPLKDTL